MHPAQKEQLCWMKEYAADPVRKIRGTCSSKWNSKKVMNHSREVHSNSLLFTSSMDSAKKCYFLNAASPSTSAMNYTEYCDVKKSASILVWYKDTTSNFSVLTSIPSFSAKNIFMLSFFLLSQKQQWFWLWDITIISNTKKLNHNGSNVNKALEEAKGSIQPYSKCFLGWNASL